MEFIPRCLNPSESFKMNIFEYSEMHTEIYIVNIFINQSVVTDVGGYFGNDTQGVLHNPFLP